MITKEQLKKEVDKLPDNLLEEVYLLLKELLTKPPSSQPRKLTFRNFQGKLDHLNIRQEAYE